MCKYPFDPPHLYIDPVYIIIIIITILYIRLINLLSQTDRFSLQNTCTLFSSG